MQNQGKSMFLETMNRTEPTTTTQRVAAHRERRRTAGRMLVTVDLPNEAVEAIDRLKEARGVRSRASVIEEALRFYIENAPRA